MMPIADAEDQPLAQIAGTPHERAETPTGHMGRGHGRMLAAVGGRSGDDRHLAVGADGLRLGDAGSPSDA